jgi:hypothetical protein
MTIMTVVHSAEISVMYPRVVISSLAKRLKSLLFAITCTLFGAWLRDHYMSLQMSTLVCMSCFVIGFPMLGIGIPSGLFRNC